jgi:hypothetical protein
MLGLIQLQELDRLLKMEEQQRLVLAARKHVEEQILQARCPSCRGVFFDFDACFAIECRT